MDNKNSEKLSELGGEEIKKDYIKPEVKYIPLKVEERLMACLKTGEELPCAGNIRNS